MFFKYAPTEIMLIANSDDENTKELIDQNKEKRNIITYGIKSEADFKATEIKQNNKGQLSFKVLKNNEFSNFFKSSIGTRKRFNARFDIFFVNFIIITSSNGC